MSEKVQIRVEDVLQMLKDGKTRKEIGDHYGLNGVNTKKLFLHPELKYKKTHKELPFEIISSEPEILEVEFEEVGSEELSEDEQEHSTSEELEVENNWENA